MWLPSQHMDKRNSEIYITTVPITEVPHQWTIGGIVLCAVFIVITWTTVLLRWFTRAFFVILGKDDVAMLISVVYTGFNFHLYTANDNAPLDILYSVLWWCYRTRAILLGQNNPPKRSHDDYDERRCFFIHSQPNLIHFVSQILIMTEVFYVWTMMMLKLSLAFFYFRLLVAKWQRRVVYAVTVLSIAFGFAYFWFAVFQCGVPGKGGPFWYKKITNQCVRQAPIDGFAYAHAAISAGTDFILSAMPILIVRNSMLSLRDKAIVCGILIIATA